MRSSLHPRQSGATLVITLAMLVLMLMLATSATRLVMLDQHAGSHRHHQVAAQLAAQAALDDALDDLRRGRTGAPLTERASFPARAGCQPGTGLCLGNRQQPGAHRDVLASTASLAYGSFTGRRAPPPGEADVAAPRYLIELVASGRNPVRWYRLNAIGFGPGGARVMLQSVVEYQRVDGQDRFTPRAWRLLPPQGQA